MANATTMVGTDLALGRKSTFLDIDSAGAAVTLDLDPKNMYTVRHLGMDNTGTADTNPVKISYENKGACAAPDATVLTVLDDQNWINSGDMDYVLCGTCQIKLDAAAGKPQVCVKQVERIRFGNESA
jgi:hypothetical protein